MEIRLNKYQERFLRCKRRFPALIAAVGTGKTFVGLLKMWKFCEKYPDSLFMLVRKEYTDLRDSTLKDMRSYFGVDFDSNKEYRFPNGSVIMARHGAELAVLKNVNLSGFLIEQAEEFDDDEVFTFLRDRLRRQTSPYRQGLLIANARGHNWLWKLWINNADEVEEINKETGEYTYSRGEYYCSTANTFANAHNLPDDFVNDLKAMQVDAPHHYAQYVANSFEELEEDDYVFNFSELLEAQRLEIVPREGYGSRIMGFDIARFGNDKCAAIGIEQTGIHYWKMFHQEQWEKKDLDYTTGRILSLSATHNNDYNIIDEDGLGGGPLDFIQRGRKRDDFEGFRNIKYSFGANRFFANPRTAAAFKLKEMVSKGFIQIPDEEVIQELMTLRYKFENDGRRRLISKDEMRKEGVKSPNLADALLMAVSLIDDVKAYQDRETAEKYGITDQYGAEEENLFKLAGIK